VGTRDLRTLWSPSVTLNQERHTKAQSSFLFFYFYFLNLLFLKSPPWNLLLADLIIVFLNSFSPQGSVLFTIPSSKQPLPSGAKQATYTTHSWDFRPCHRRPPRQTHTTLLRQALSQPWGVPGRARSAFCDGPGSAPPTAGDWPAGSAEPGPVGLMDPSSVTDRRSEFMYMIELPI